VEDIPATDNAKVIAESIRQIPSHWSLTPLQDKAPKRLDWQTEAFIPHEVIASLITKGSRLQVSERVKPTDDIGLVTGCELVTLPVDY
jgi:energy-converting hydrogenase Eha subunit A